jgi:biopolymer transport protein ExbD
MARQRRGIQAENGELNMTAMIDVVFQLLIFFIVTTKPEDVITNLDVFRPSPEQQKKEQLEVPNLVKIQIFPDGFMINDKRVPLPDLESLVAKLASYSKEQTILIMCSSLSRHGDLVRVLDLCTKNGLKNLSVISTN